MIFDIVPDRSNPNFKHDFKAFCAFMREHHPSIIGRKRFCASKEEATAKLREDCWSFRYKLEPISDFVETTFSAKEMAALKIVVDFAAKHCGGGEDTIGAIMYTGAFHQLNRIDDLPNANASIGAVCDLARKIDCYGD